MPKKTEMEDPLGFFNMHSVAKLQKNEGVLFGGKNVKKVAQCWTKSKGWTLWSCPVLYVTLLYVLLKPFWFSSLGQQVKFEILKKFW